ncbi:MAG: ATP-binding cassette domain-containing protein [Gammaproteobacteria bacterium]|nr:ATP-binding cassette domain-containing protein [Gammaproteobacteria bacterium]
MSNQLLSVKQLCVGYPQHQGWWAVKKHMVLDNITFTVGKSEIVGVVGESGCGKSTLARSIMNLIPVESGSIEFSGQSILQASPSQMHTIRRSLQMVFQDPYSSLNPQIHIDQIIAEPLRYFQPQLDSDQRLQQVAVISRNVGLPEYCLARYPHQLSGGQCQRVSIARALICKPELVVCDEVVSALDVSVQAQLLNLFVSLTRASSLSLLFISHDLRVIRQICHRVLVMYRGRLVEEADCDELFNNPKHDYTRKLLQSMPKQPVI